MKIPPAIFAFAIQLLDAGRYPEALAMARIEWEPEPFDAALWRFDNCSYLAMREIGTAILGVLIDASDSLAEAME